MQLVVLLHSSRHGREIVTSLSPCTISVSGQHWTSMLRNSDQACYPAATEVSLRSLPVNFESFGSHSGGTEQTAFSAEDCRLAISLRLFPVLFVGRGRKSGMPMSQGQSSLVTHHTRRI
jgi:hypothetical protein